jgi:glycosyltransferase involved in cell wall biosynthesis
MIVFDFSVIVPAHNEEAWIEPCLEALLAQDEAAGVVQVLVVANACTDSTVALAERYIPQAEARGWQMIVFNLEEGGKLNALNRAEEAVLGRNRVYLDADVICDPELLGQLRAALDCRDPRYATGTLVVAPARSWVTQRYGDFWTRLPFVKGGAVGAGLFAVNPAGRARWDRFPDIISDDTFVRLQFLPEERIEVLASYQWPMVEGFLNLVRVRRRQDVGVAELKSLYPSYAQNEGKAKITIRHLGALAVTVPIGFVVYISVHIVTRFLPAKKVWTRGR